MTKKFNAKLLQDKIDELTQKNRLLNEIVLHYADPSKDWDNGELARKMIKKIHRGYKPVISEMALMFKEKEVYPFVEFQNVIETEEEDYE